MMALSFELFPAFSAGEVPSKLVVFSMRASDSSLSMAVRMSCTHESRSFVSAQLRSNDFAVEPVGVTMKSLSLPFEPDREEAEKKQTKNGHQHMRTDSRFSVACCMLCFCVLLVGSTVIPMSGMMCFSLNVTPRPSTSFLKSAYRRMSLKRKLEGGKTQRTTGSAGK